MKRILVTGAGNIGGLIAELLAASGDYAVTLVDRSAQALATTHGRPGVEGLALDLADGAALREALPGHFAVVNAAPYSLTAPIAAAAHACRVHYLDLTEDVAATRTVNDLARTAAAAMIPQCGLAPGFIAIVGMHLARRFERLDALRLRVGALPQFPSNALGYNLTWSTAGVINEYCQPCQAIVDGQQTARPPLEELERFSLHGVQYEAFNTSGGLGSLCDSLAGQVRQLNYRTIRYPGHRDAMKLLLHDMRLAERPGVLAELLESAIPGTSQDVVVIFATATGVRLGRMWQETFARCLYPMMLAGQLRTAIQASTASAVCTVLDLLAAGRLATRGLVRQEDIALEDFLDNRFGRVYAPESAQAPAASGAGSGTAESRV